jgi:CRP-like cAMP-binding protein
MYSNHHQVLHNYLKNCTELNEDEITRIVGHFQLKKLKKDEVLISANSTVRCLGFVTEGILYALEEHPNEECQYLYYIQPGQFFSEIDGYYDHVPASYSIVAYGKAEVLCLSLENLNKLKEEMPQLKTLVPKFGENSFREINKMQSILTIRLKKRRYYRFCHRFPNLTGKLSSKALSLFLQINYSYLRHLRSDMHKNCAF